MLKFLLKLAAVLVGAGGIAVLALLVPCIVMDGALLQCGLRTEHSSASCGACCAVDA